MQEAQLSDHFDNTRLTPDAATSSIEQLTPALYRSCICWGMMSRMRSWPVVATPPACSTRKAIGKHCNTADVLEQLNQAQRCFICGAGMHCWALLLWMRRHWGNRGLWCRPAVTLLISCDPVLINHSSIVLFSHCTSMSILQRCCSTSAHVWTLWGCSSMVCQ
jgi:adenosylmethionine-8-amino-7-oxononanoate aminotransferase